MYVICFSVLCVLIDLYSRTQVLVPHPLNDPTEFGSLGDLHGISRKEGFVIICNYTQDITSPSYVTTVKLGYIKLCFYEYMVYIEVLSMPERNPIDFHVK